MLYVLRTKLFYVEQLLEQQEYVLLQFHKFFVTEKHLVFINKLIQESFWVLLCVAISHDFAIIWNIVNLFVIKGFYKLL